MKKTLIITACFVAGLFFAGCEKENVLIAGETNPPANAAFLKINYASAYALNPSVQLSVDDVRVSNLITARTPFPGGGFNTGGASSNDYLVTDSGTTSISVSIPNKNTNTDSVLIFDKDVILESQKYYSLHIADTGANIKYLLLQDDRTKPDTSLAKLRFVNLMPNAPLVDLYYGNTIVASAIPFMGASGYFTVPTAAPALAWSVKETGSTTTLATYTSGNTILNQRVYTAFAMGYKGQTSAQRKPYVSFYLNN